MGQLTLMRYLDLELRAIDEVRNIRRAYPYAFRAQGIHRGARPPTPGKVHDADMRNVSRLVALGYTDESAFRSLAKVLGDAGELPEGLDLARIFWVSGGGSGLHAWVERRYLDALNIPQIYIVDSDRTAAAGDVKEATLRLARTIRDQGNGQVVILTKREIENYLHPAAISRATGGIVDFAGSVADLDYCDMEAEFDTHVLKRIHNRDFEMYPIDHQGQSIAVKKKKAKEIICAVAYPLASAAISIL